jgi:hypothetical protein
MATEDSSGAAGRNRWSAAVRRKMRELAELIRQEKFGEDLPPLELTWVEIEDIGHEVGRLTAAEVDQELQRSHAEHFDHPHACPSCGRRGSTSVRHRDLQTRDGTVDLAEPACYCNACERSFFPSTGAFET